MPKPKPGESRNDFVGRCVPMKMREGMEQDAAMGACEGIYSGKKKEEEEEDQKFQQNVKETPVHRTMVVEELSEESTGIKTADLPKAEDFWNQ